VCGCGDKQVTTPRRLLHTTDDTSHITVNAHAPARQLTWSRIPHRYSTHTNTPALFFVTHTHGNAPTRRHGTRTSLALRFTDPDTAPSSTQRTRNMLLVQGLQTGTGCPPPPPELVTSPLCDDLVPPCPHQRGQERKSPSHDATRRETQRHTSSGSTPALESCDWPDRHDG
jgi:hypothetical protein